MSQANGHRPRTVLVGIRLAIPNALTLLRLGFGLVFPWLPSGWRLPVFLAAAMTEALDGSLARILRATSTFGQLLDPIADKVFVLAVLGTLAVAGILPPWSIPLVAARDLLVLAGGLWVVGRQGRSGLKRMPPTILGKLATGAQFLLLLGVLAQPGVAWSLPMIPMLWITSALSLAAGIDYLRRFE